MSNRQNNHHLSVLADEYSRYLGELLELLTLENEALKNREFERIRACTEQKEILLSQLEKLDAQRIIAEQQEEHSTGTSTHSSFNEKFASLLKKCSELNALNGGIVEISKQFNQRMLNTILGAAAQDNNLYDSAGNNSGNRLKQVFAKI